MDILLGYHPLFFAMGGLLILLAGVKVHGDGIIDEPYEYAPTTMGIILLMIGVLLWYQVDDRKRHAERFDVLNRFHTCITDGKTPVMIESEMTGCYSFGRTR